MSSLFKTVLVKFGNNRKKKVTFEKTGFYSDLESLKIAFNDSRVSDSNLENILKTCSSVVFTSYDSTFDQEVEVCDEDEIKNNSCYSAEFLYDIQFPVGQTNLHMDIKVSSPSHSPIKFIDIDKLKTPVKKDVCRNIDLRDDSNDMFMNNAEDMISSVENCDESDEDMHTSSMMLDNQFCVDTSFTKSQGLPRPVLKYPCELPTFSDKIEDAIANNMVLMHYSLFVRECRGHYHHLTGGKATKAEHAAYVRSVLDKYPVFKDPMCPDKPYVSMHNYTYNWYCTLNIS